MEYCYCAYRLEIGFGIGGLKFGSSWLGDPLTRTDLWEMMKPRQHTHDLCLPQRF